MALSKGQAIGRYEVLSLLGSGGMGEVYRVRDARLGREVALKVLPAAFANDPDRLARFELEARAVGRLQHPNVLALYDVGTHESGSPYLVTELLEGESLRQRLGMRGGAVEPQRAIELAQQILRGLAAAHEQGIVHRDLKPENLFLTRDGQLKILDFGLAKLQPPKDLIEQETKGFTDRAEPALTREGHVLGTLSYMAPEQLRGHTADARSDLFAFGAVFYEMLSGQRAFRGETPADTISAVLSDEPRREPLEQRSVPLAVQRILDRCLQKAPEDRFRSARDVAFALEAISGTAWAATAAAPAPRRGQPTRREVVAAIAGSLAVGGASGVWELLRRRRATTAPGTPTFRALTFRRGTILGARFVDPDTVVYSASWDGQPSELYSMFAGAPEARPLGIHDAHLYGVSRNRELAIVMNKERELGVGQGTLARVPLAGGAPRPLVEGITEAGWGPDGESLCVSDYPTGRLEYPIGKLLWRAEGGCQSVRVSPDGKRVAFLGDEGVEVITVGGRHEVLARTPEWILGLAWSPDATEVWYTGGESGTRRVVWAVDLAGRQRLLATSPGSLSIDDTAPGGRALLTSGFGRWGVEAVIDGGDRPRDLNVSPRNRVAGLSADGRYALLWDMSRPEHSMYLRPLDGSPPVRLGEGVPLAFSADDRWVLCRQGRPPRLVELPVGAGTPRALRCEVTPDTEYVGRTALWSHDGERLFIAIRERAGRRIVACSRAGDVEPLTPLNVWARFALSPDAAWIATWDRPQGVATLYPTAGGPSRALSGERAEPVGFSDDGRTLILAEMVTPSRCLLVRRDLETGRRQPWRAFEMSDPAGVVGVGGVMMSRNGAVIVYGYKRLLTELYLAEGLA